MDSPCKFRGDLCVFAAAPGLVQVIRRFAAVSSTKAFKNVAKRALVSN